MSTVLLCWYAGGWACIADDCRRPYVDDIDIGSMIAIFAAWPIVAVFSVNKWLPMLLKTVVWRKS